MSKAYIVKDGIIIGETTARYSYEREDGAVVIKPLTKEVPTLGSPTIPSFMY